MQAARGPTSSGCRTAQMTWEEEKVNEELPRYLTRRTERCLPSPGGNLSLKQAAYMTAISRSRARGSTPGI